MRGQWNISPSPPLSYPDYRDLRDQNHSLVGILAYNHDWLTLTGGARRSGSTSANVSSNYFDLLGVRPLLGRFFRPEEETRPDAVPYVVLELLVVEDAVCRRPGDRGQVDRDRAAPCDGDRRGAGGIHRSDAGDSRGCCG